MTKDIEREAFEKALAGNNIHNLKVCTIFDDEKNEYFASDVCDPSEDHIVESINLSWRMWQAAKAQAVPDGFVVVPVQCPDPDFADSLFDELSKKAIGEFGDDLLIHFSDIDEEKIWALMVEAAQESTND